MVVAVAVADLVRWQFFAAEPSGFGQIVPMAPGTGSMFALLGSALGLALFWPARRNARRIAVALCAGVAAVAVSTGFDHLNGRFPAWESWLVPDGPIVDGFSTGHISSQTAVLLLLSDFALFALLMRPAGWVPWRSAGMFAAILVELFALVTLVSYAAGNPPVANEGWLKAAPLVMFEFTAFNFALLLSASAINRLRHWFFGTDTAAPEFAPISREERLAIGLLAGVGLLALGAGVVYLRVKTKEFQSRSLEAVRTITDLKAGQIEQWRRERLGDARALMRMPSLAETVSALGKGQASATQRAEIIGWLKQFAQSYGYAKVVVLNGAMEPLLAEPCEADPAAAGWREKLRELRPDSDVMELPPYIDPAGVLRWDLLVPLRAAPDTALDGAILLQTNPTRYILQNLQSWPAEYQTGQTMLWDREGDRLISLGGYRPGPGAAPEELRPFGMTRSISDPRSQSMLTRAVRGESGAGEDIDHRGVTVIGLARAIPNSPWLLSSRVDSSEVYAPLRRDAIGIAGILAGLLVTTGLATSWLWRQRQTNLLHERVTAELEQKRLAARLGMVMRHAKDIIILTDEQMRFVEANQQALDTYGWTKGRCCA